jgi:hypothetical protein
MIWNKLKHSNYFKEPVEHIHSLDFFDTLEYDRLYENQKNLQHKLWQEFDEKYKLGFEFKDDISLIDTKRDVIAIWCFKERSDNAKPPQINLAGKQLPYFPNALIITSCKDIKIDEAPKKYIRRPFVQLDITESKFKEICQLINKN